MKEYVKELQRLLEPPCGSEASQQGFRRRVQQKGESPLMYFGDKAALWKYAWPAGQRDIGTLLDEATAGLLNEDLRREMRKSSAKSEDGYSRDLEAAMNCEGGSWWPVRRGATPGSCSRVWQVLER